MRESLGLLLLVGSLTACSSSSPGSSSSTTTFQRDCAFRLSCGDGTNSYQGAGSIGSCVSSQLTEFAMGASFPDDAQQMVDCANLPTCDEWLACLSHDHGPAYCATHSGDSCDGDLWLHCDNTSSSGVAFDCAAHGQKCVASGSQADCVDASQTACDPATPSHCEGNRWVGCRSGLLLPFSLDCTQVYEGGTCGVVTVGGTTSAGCVRPGPACQQSAAACDGNTLVVCDSRSNHEIRIDCTTYQPGGRCGVERGVAVCLPRGNACSPDQADRCNGNQLESCINGDYRGLDCTSLGFRTCSVENVGGEMRSVCVH